jgi:TatD DNase family protein
MDDCLAILDAWECPNKRVVFHCFGGGPQDVQNLMARGFYVSYTGTITFDNAQDVRDAAKLVPLDRVFLETDCPYLSPEPKRKVKPNEPALLVHTAAKLAQLHNLSPEEIAKITTQNSCAFFSLD